MKLYLEKKDPIIDEIIKSCFPAYSGKKISISTEIPSSLDSYWDGGSKDYYCFYNLADKKTFNVQTNHPMFESQNPRNLQYLPEGILLVRHSIFCGKDMGITIFANKKDLTSMIPENTETISKEELIVLTATRSFKNTYAGQSEVRFKEANRRTGISWETWSKTKQTLISKGYLSKNGAINASGRNILENAEKIYL